MRKALIAALVVSGVLAAAAGAITTNGFPDNGRHPNVGAILVPARSGVGYAEVCSGTLVSATLFLTASHCAAFLESDPRPEFVTFDETTVEDNPTGLIPATAITNPSYKSGYRNDVSLMRLETPVTGITPAKLPPLGYLDTLDLKQSTKMTVVGYGTREQEVVKGEGPTFPFEGSREYAIGSFNALTPQWLKMSQNQAHGDGGAGYGDSGGPTFLGSGDDESDIVVAVTSTGDVPCYSTNVSGRTDSPSARAFLAQHGL
ncbi:MAG TPA: trypsin-like serine protease [Gaiella sp.]|jgi:secreted trypsin-like serine protease|nr:trypsin-like serine protease [Gaiella sp.]